MAKTAFAATDTELKRKAQARATKHAVEVLRKYVRGMSRDSLVYHMLKEELTELGYWKNRPRGRRINPWNR